ncbi:hypothetical protein D3C71_2110840 [compost metagenome]
MKIVGAQDMSTEPPSLGEAPIGHLHGASTDFIDRSDIPTAMMQPRAVSLGECDQVGIASVNAMHETYAIA